MRDEWTSSSISLISRGVYLIVRMQINTHASKAQVMTVTCSLFLFFLLVVVLANDPVADVTATQEPEPQVHSHLGVNHTENVQHSQVNQLGRKGAFETVWQNVIINENLECSRCRLTRLIGCQRGVCYYRCYRRCYDGNGTSWDEAIRFTLRGSRRRR